jgi:hypothetical protein
MPSEPGELGSFSRITAVTPLLDNVSNEMTQNSYDVLVLLYRYSTIQSLFTSTASEIAMPSEPGELGSFSRMARPDAVRGEGLGCSVAPLQQEQQQEQRQQQQPGKF